MICLVFNSTVCSPENQIPMHEMTGYYEPHYHTAHHNNRNYAPSNATVPRLDGVRSLQYHPEPVNYVHEDEGYLTVITHCFPSVLSLLLLLRYISPLMLKPHVSVLYVRICSAC